MSGHTKGPWSVFDADPLTVVANAGRGLQRVCDTYDDEEWENVADDVETAKANARLIAAAPDMLEALRHLRIITRRSGLISDAEVTELEQRYGASLTWSELVAAVHAAVEAAIAKAEGKTWTEVLP